MKKKLLDEHNKQEIIHRILQLEPASKGTWGNMTVNEMLFHCNKINKNILDAKPPDNVPTFKEKLMKIVGLHLMKGFPKGVKTSSKYLPQPIDNIDFHTLQKELVDSIQYISHYKSAIYGIHPFFGPLNTQEWRRFIWMHMDHHLRQFNI